MARPLSATDDEILDAACAVVARRGSDGFTLSEVARDVGLSRAALILRFQSADDLKRSSLQRLADRFDDRINAVAFEPGARGLLALADAIGGMIGGRENLTTFMFELNANMRDPELAMIEEQRGDTLRRAIARILPPLPVSAADAANAFMANLTGSIMQWQTTGDGNAARFLRERTVIWLTLAGIPVDEA